MKRNKILTRIILLSFITGSIMYATGLVQFNHTHIEKSYHDMSMTELQEEVEMLSKDGALPFDMGCELIKRWTRTS